jgi:hypothetical protein
MGGGAQVVMLPTVQLSPTYPNAVSGSLCYTAVVPVLNQLMFTDPFPSNNSKYEHMDRLRWAQVPWYTA